MFPRLRPRMLGCTVLAAALLAAVALVSPQQLPVLLYKGALVCLAGVAGYWLDRWAFPYARPDSYLIHDWRAAPSGVPNQADHPVADGIYGGFFAAAMLRRAIIMAGAMLAVGLGL